MNHIQPSFDLESKPTSWQLLIYSLQYLMLNSVLYCFNNMFSLT